MTRMPETDRIRNGRRMAVLIANALKFGYITCVFCGDVTHTPQVDHVIPRKAGCDPKDISNAAVACPSCNGRKQDRAVADVFGEEVAAKLNAWLDERVYTSSSMGSSTYHLSPIIQDRKAN